MVVFVEDEVLVPGGGGVSGRADCKISAKLVPIQFSLAAVSLTKVISSEIVKTNWQIKITFSDSD